MKGDSTYARLQSLGRTVVFGLCRWEAAGFERIPADGPAIVAANHVSYLDPPLLGTLSPRLIRFIAKRELFTLPMLGPLLGRFLRSIGTFPVERRRPDVRAVRESLRVLERGEVLGIFPEGTRNKLPSLAPFLDGVGWLAIKSRAPVIPVAIHGYLPLWRGSQWTRPGRLRILCGEPLHFPASQYPNGRKPFRAAATREVGRAIAALLEEASVASFPLRRVTNGSMGEAAIPIAGEVAAERASKG